MLESLTSPILEPGLTQRGVTVAGLGAAVPERVVANAPIAERLGVEEDWIVSRTGIRERRWLRDDETLADLATAAAERALGSATADLVIVATTSPDDLIPALAPEIAGRVGATAGFDVNAACTGFLTAIALAAGQIESGRAESVLVIGAERLSAMLDPADKGTAAIFADGAGAMLLTAMAGGSSLAPVVLRSEAQRDLLYATRESGRIAMAGQDVFRHAVTRMTEATHAALERAGTVHDDIDLFVYHQANSRIVRAVGQRLGLDPARVVDCIETYGNVSAASLPLALATARDQGRLFPGARVLLSAFGAGFVWGAVVLEW
jgi:3-oxoacyl-[acyl-carrier-protein] synthase III